MKFFFVSMVFLAISNTQFATGKWVLEIQLHDYSNPSNAIYDVAHDTYRCCEPCPAGQGTPSSDSLDTLNCTCILDGKIRYCDIQLRICAGYRSSSETCFNTDPITNGLDVNFDFSLDTIFSNVMVYDTFRFNGTSVPNDHISVFIRVFEYDPAFSPSLDEFDLSLPFKVLPYFPSPLTYEGTYHIAFITISYRMYCFENFYGPFCQTYCEASNDDSDGYYTCDCNGNKVCLEEYTNPMNNCRERLTLTTTETATPPPTTTTKLTTIIITSTITRSAPCTVTTSNDTRASTLSDNVRAWQGATFGLLVLVSVSIGIIVGMCFIVISGRAKRNRPTTEMNHTIQNLAYHEGTLLSQGPVHNDVNNVLYNDNQLRDDLNYNRPQAPLPINYEKKKPYYDDVSLEEEPTEEYDKINHHN